MSVHAAVAWTSAVIPERYQRTTWMDFNGMHEEIKQSIAFAKAGGDYGASGLFIWGESGSGKTMLAASTLRYMAWSRGLVGQWANVSDLLCRLRSTMSDTNTTEQEIIQRYALADALVLDDLGSELGTDWAATVIYNVMNKRSDRYGPTIITSNLSLEQINKQLGARIADRILRMTRRKYITHVKGGSYWLEHEPYVMPERVADPTDNSDTCPLNRNTNKRAKELDKDEYRNNAERQ